MKMNKETLAFAEWLNIHCKPSNKLKEGKVAWNHYCPSSLRPLGRFTTEEMYNEFKGLYQCEKICTVTKEPCKYICVIIDCFLLNKDKKAQSSLVKTSHPVS